MNSETIVALSTPAGRSGIGVVRLSGTAALDVTRRLIRDLEFAPAPRRVYLKNICDLQTGEPIDTAIVTYFAAPNSFTGEDAVEISCHGSPVILRQTIDFALQAGARLAAPGEFSLRALANNRLNLSQAEAIRDLIDAQTTAQARQAARQLGGELSAELQPLKDKLLHVIVVLESALEFVEDDLPDVAYTNIQTALDEILVKLRRLAETYRAGRLLREGLRVAFVGRPNVGKSSLFNALLGEERAIVTDVPGTTRDTLRETFSVGGIPVSLVDTAGMRETTDQVESIGVERTRRAVTEADAVIVVLDGSQPLTREDHQVLREVEQNAADRAVVAVNKSDLEKANFDLNVSPEKVVAVSAVTGRGLDELQKVLLQPFADYSEASESGFLIADARHHDLLRRAELEITSSQNLLDQRVSEEIALVGLHNALRLLGQITGETTPEDVLTRIFATFCIGK